MKAAPAEDAGVVDAHRYTEAQRAELGRRKSRLVNLQREMRRRHFGTQGHVEPPRGLPTALRGVWPPDVEAQVVSVGLHRGMHLSKPAPGRWRLMTRWLTPLSEAETRAALQRHLRDIEWLGEGEPLRFPIAHPGMGRLSARFITHPERATAVEFELERPDAGAPLQAPEALLAETPAWVKGVARDILGFEFDWHHGVVPGGRFTDVVRLAVTVGGDHAVITEALRRRLAETGYAVDPTNEKMYRGPGRTTCRSVKHGDALVIHHQRHWKR